eukprot:CAMPEP_0196582036 /NCGR_PEP_ID=MMETSP1081-20130531/37147_1 /TAXON_ID=36882 /ORGANISM="Pyramimonas amylifera, Strain CCMP720" /LENGTH=181 /DNA_ID=CAMNT_0041902499 /DNA_START=84 /DNA_END=629 /DNA_ORIENTATION=+
MNESLIISLLSPFILLFVTVFADDISLSVSVTDPAEAMSAVPAEVLVSDGAQASTSAGSSSIIPDDTMGESGAAFAADAGLNSAASVSVDDTKDATLVADERQALLEQNNMDLILYGALALSILGVPAIIYKMCYATGGAPSGLSNVVTMERGGKPNGAAPTTRYNTEQLRQTVARLRAQV